MRRPLVARFVCHALSFGLAWLGVIGPPGSSALGQEPPTPPRSQGRASAAQVGTVMALLATFQEAGVLPPESSPEANQLIKALIQFQAAFMKSRDPAVARVLTDALAAKLGAAAPTAAQAFRSNGWTSESLEAVVDYVTASPPWEQGSFERGLRTYNLERQDFELLARIFVVARRDLQRQGQDLHQVYRVRRMDMPGAARP